MFKIQQFLSLDVIIILEKVLENFQRSKMKRNESQCLTVAYEKKEKIFLVRTNKEK